MKGIGVDIVDLERLDIDNERFIKHILSSREYQLFTEMKSARRKLEFLGGRFAGKEAYMKACHVGIGAISFQDIEILNDESGAPYLHDPQAQISISHEKNMQLHLY
ncbi:holo-ACP synthase [Allocoprobacillus halotolerans]|uniref:Holo-ACP synthase n=1 Tax=Allocoprobacillus halotolerans TaxID=2944914 RepID=A0ABY5I1A7_9FIRM|nr:holo-ACP synthase [Allocoprobacillus halotolerans]UTY38725.1 holo-ACP synthase [Allocoprobacillus halotolerans]